MKKQVRKILKKILVYGLATSILFTSCFSYKKINAHATSVAVGLGAYTLYEICLYIGGLAITTLGIGYAYENRDEIAEFGKSVIDSITDFSSVGWFMGSHSVNGDYVYGTEALQEVQQTNWTVIQGGGQSAKNDNDNDGDKDSDDRDSELNLNKAFLTSSGVSLITNTIQSLFNSWKNKDENSVLSNKYGAIDKYFYDWGVFNGYEMTDDGKYTGYFSLRRYAGQPHEEHYYYEVVSSYPIIIKHAFDYDNTTDWSSVQIVYSYDHSTGYLNGEESWVGHISLYIPEIKSGKYKIETNLPIFSDYSYCEGFTNTYTYNPDGIINASKVYRVTDWIDDDDDAWKGHLEDIASSLRSLQDMTAIAQASTEGALNNQPSKEEYEDLVVGLTTQYIPSNEPITNPIYYPATNTTPPLGPSDFPNYEPPSGGSDSDGGSNDDGGSNENGGSDEDIEIDLDGLTSIFNIIFYLIMIIIMLIYLFISCLAFIVMIFRIPASSSMLPQDMVLGYEHLQTIMIPGMNISIYHFAMALIYLFIIFAIIKLIRLEINGFKFPRSYK